MFDNKYIRLELDKEKQKFIMTKEEYVKKYGKKTNKCVICKKHYRLPTFIYEPRDKICFTCELKISI